MSEHRGGSGWSVRVGADSTDSGSNSATCVPASDALSPVSLPRLLSAGGRLDLAAHVRRFGLLRRSSAADAERAGSGLIRSVELAGLLGRGGAGFPTGRKLRAAAESAARARGALVVVNAMEGEPASAEDRVLLRLAPHLVLDGAALVATAIGATEVVVCVPRTGRTVAWADMPGPTTSSGLSPELGPKGIGEGPDPQWGPADDVEDAARSVLSAIRERGQGEWDAVPVSVARPPDRYVSGEGSALARWLGGGPALPAFSRSRLTESGIGGLPTLLDNAETLAHVALIGRYGASWFRALGTQADPGTALVTVSGAVGRPGVAEVPLGTTLAELFAAAGGLSEPVQAVLLGGYGGRWVPLEGALGLPLTSGGSDGASIGPGIVVALPKSACGLVETARVARYMAGEGAGQCGPCVYGLPALAGAVEALARPASPASASAAVRQIARWGQQIEGRGACHHPDGVVRLVRSALAAFGDDVLGHSTGVPCPFVERPAVLPLPGAARANDRSRV